MIKQRTYVLLAVILLVLLIDQFIAYAHIVPDTFKGNRLYADFSFYYTQHPLFCCLVYGAGYFVLASLGAPGIRFILIAAGSLLGMAPAIIISSVAGTLGTLPGYLAGRYLFTVRVHTRYGAFLQRIRQYAQKDALSYLFALRLSALIPNIFINLIYGGAKFTNWLAYTFVSFLGLLPNVALYVYMGELLQNAKLGPLWSRIDLLLIVLSVMPLLLKRLPLLKRFSLQDED